MTKEKTSTKSTAIEKAAGVKRNTITKNQLIDLTKCICSEIVTIPDEEFSQFYGQIQSGRLLDRDSVHFYYNQNASDDLDNAIGLIRNDPLYVDVSKKRITNAYTDLIHNIKLHAEIPDQELAGRIDSFLRELRFSIKEWKFIMPIERLELSDLAEVQIGSVRIVPFDVLIAENKWISEHNLFIIKEFENKICGELLVRGESDEAKSKGKSGIEQVINLLRAYIPIIYRNEQHKKIGLTKYELKKHDCLIIDDQGMISGEGLNLGPFGNYVLSSEIYNSLKTDYSLDEINNILSIDHFSRSDLEKSIIMAVTWIGLGADDDVICDKFLKYAFALECLLIKRSQEGDKSDPIAKRAAFLLGETVIDSKKIVSDLKQLFIIRNNIVHQGFEPGDEKIIEEYAKKMYYYSMRTLIKLSKKLVEYEDIDDLVNQMDEQMYSRGTIDLSKAETF